jgi:IclR family transcriptional regulator, KDG regulon repressor
MVPRGKGNGSDLPAREIDFLERLMASAKSIKRPTVGLKAARPKSGDPEKPRLDITLVKGISVLSALAMSNTQLGVSALGAEVGLGKSNVHRLLTTLVELGFAQKEPGTKRYSATLKLWELGSMVLDRNLLRRAARPVLRELFDKTGNTVFLTLLSGTDILYIEKIDSPHGPRSPTRAGLRVPAAFTAAGKALLANQRDPEILLDRIIATVPEATTLNRARLLKEFAAIVEKGYAFSEGGWTKGINSLAVVVPHEIRPPIAALGIAGSPSYLNAAQTKQLMPMMVEGAARIAELLGPTDIGP